MFKFVFLSTHESLGCKSEVILNVRFFIYSLFLFPYSAPLPRVVESKMRDNKRENETSEKILHPHPSTSVRIFLPSLSSREKNEYLRSLQTSQTVYVVREMFLDFSCSCILLHTSM